MGDNHAFGGSILEADQRAGRRCGLSDCIAGFGGRDFSLGVNADGQRITSLYRLMEFGRQAGPISEMRQVGFLATFSEKPVTRDDANIPKIDANDRPGPAAS